MLPWNRSLSALGLTLMLANPVAAQFGPSPVVVARVVQRDVAAGQTFVGTIIPVKRSAVGSAVDGRVVEYPIEIGDRVSKGQPLCKLLTETISLQIAAAEAELRLRKEELRELQNGSRPEEILNSKARVAALQAQHTYASARLKRVELLASQGQTITQEQLEQARSAATEAEQMLRAEEQLLKLLEQGPREERVAQAQARHDAQVEQVQQLKDQLRKHTMIAPFDGYVSSKQTELGEWVTRGQVVAEVVYLDDVDVEAHVLDSQIDSVRIGQDVRVELPALKQPQYVGEVAYISPQGDVKSRTFPVRVRVKNTIREDGPAIKAAMLARVTLPVGQTRAALLVPKDTIVFGGPAPMVYVVGPAAPPPGGPPPAAAKATPAPPPDPNAPPVESVRPVPVVLGVADGNLVEVTADLKPGDRVVILGNERLRPGAPVQVIRELAGDPNTAEQTVPRS